MTDSPHPDALEPDDTETGSADQTAPEEAPDTDSSKDAELEELIRAAKDAPSSQSSQSSPSSPPPFASLPLSTVLKTQLTRDAIQRRPPKLPTEFESLNKLLGGGLSPGLIILGGSPNLGKSTLAIQMAEYLSQKVPVLYYSLEMTPDRIASKLLSRQYFHECAKASTTRTPKTADEIISNKITSEEWPFIDQARQRVLERTEQLYVIEKLPGWDGEPLPFTSRNIAAHVRRFIQSRREEDPAASPPLVMVDYLQIIQPPEGPSRSERQVVEDNLNQMVSLSRGEGLIVLLISSLSRGSYDAPLKMDSFKETGGIEYSADVLLGLQFQAVMNLRKGERLDIDAEKNKPAGTPREVELVILKQRYGASGTHVPLRYYADYDCFEAQPDPQMPALVIPPKPAGQPQAPSPAPLQEQEPAAPAQLPSPQEPEPPVPLQPRPQRPFYLNNTMIANEIRRGAFGEDLVCQVLPRSKVTTTYSLSGRLTGYDCDVADAVSTRYWTDPKESFSLRQILQILSGDRKQTLTSDKKQELLASLRRLRETEITICCTQEMKTRGVSVPELKKRLGADSELILQGPVLSLREVEGKPDWFLFDDSVPDPLPLYIYSRWNRQIISFPDGLLPIPQGGRRKLSDTADNIFLKRFLIRRLEQIRYLEARPESSDFASRLRSISFQPEGHLSQELELPPEKPAQNKKLRKLLATARIILNHYHRIGYLEQECRIQRTPGKIGSLLIKGEIRDPAMLLEGELQDAADLISQIIVE